MSDGKTKFVTMRMQPALYDAIQESAVREGRTVTNWIEHYAGVVFALRRLVTLRQEALKALDEAANRGDNRAMGVIVQVIEPLDRHILLLESRGELLSPDALDTLENATRKTLAATRTARK